MNIYKFLHLNFKKVRNIHYILNFSFQIISIISFKKYFYVSLGNNFFTVFCGGPLVVETPGTAQFAGAPTGFFPGEGHGRRKWSVVGGHVAMAEHEPITGFWGQSPQRGPGAEPLVRGSGGKAP